MANARGATVIAVRLVPWLLFPEDGVEEVSSFSVVAKIALLGSPDATRRLLRALSAGL
jgi:hypothetical protein